MSKNLPTVKQLNYLVQLAEHRHFGKAAQACYVSQSALSTAINELEQNLGVVLFERGSKILLTPVGESLVDQAHKILNSLTNFCEFAEQSSGSFQSDLKLGVIPTIAPFLLPRILKSVHKTYGQNKLFIREDLSPNLIDYLNRGELDVLLFALPYELGNLVSETLFEDELLICMPEGHTLTARETISLKELQQQDILLLEDGHCLRDQSLKACELQTDKLTIPYQATSLNTLVQMVANNIGITLLPEMAVNANITHDTNAKTRKISSTKTVSRDIALVWRRNSPRESEFKELGKIINKNR